MYPKFEEASKEMLAEDKDVEEKCYMTDEVAKLGTVAAEKTEVAAKPGVEAADSFMEAVKLSMEAAEKALGEDTAALRRFSTELLMRSICRCRNSRQSWKQQWLQPVPCDMSAHDRTDNERFIRIEMIEDFEEDGIYEVNAV